VDGVIALTHGLGCGIDSLVTASRSCVAPSRLRRPPNFHSVLFIGLGCETNQISGILGSAG